MFLKRLKGEISKALSLRWQRIIFHQLVEEIKPPIKDFWQAVKYFIDNDLLLGWFLTIEVVAIRVAKNRTGRNSKEAQCLLDVFQIIMDILDSTQNEEGLDNLQEIADKYPEAFAIFKMKSITSHLN